MPFIVLLLMLLMSLKQSGFRGFRVSELPNLFKLLSTMLF
jgi:hypothetical protein